jgi:hypothetical protein
MNQGLVDCQPPVAGKVRPSLTFKGWRIYEELQRQSSDSRTAFMAMKFGRPRADTMFRDHFIPAVEATGFKLQRLDTRPKAGLIDARMEVDIRTARFLIADLTHGNRGAYWEAGFAHGLGKPVFYTLRRGLFQAGQHPFRYQSSLYCIVERYRAGTCGGGLEGGDPRHFAGRGETTG